MRKSKIFTTI